MEELEISGKRYISTRSAAKKYKYHADYIGQLIRGKKIVGQKVGRSWYVDADSLETYLNAPRTEDVQEKGAAAEIPVRSEVAEAEREENNPEEETVETKSAPAIIMQSFRRPLQVEDVQIEPVQEKNKEADFMEVLSETVRDSIHIPIRRSAEPENKPSGLRYIDEPFSSLPEVRKSSNKKAYSNAVYDNAADAEEIFSNEETVQPAAPRQAILVPALSIATLGAVAFAVVALGSLMVNYTAVVEAGKTASVGYSLD